MSKFDIKVTGGESIRLLTAGKYCDRDILVTAEGGGGFTPPEDEFLTPELVYQTTRPSGWLKMPTPNDYECYCLGQLLPGLNGHFYVTVTFTGTCTIEFGTVVSGAFVAKESHTPTSATGFYATLAYNNYGDALADGTRQYMARIYGTNITNINFRQGAGGHRFVNIVDIVSGISSDFTAGDHNNFKSGLRSLQYLRFVGNGTPRFLSAKFVGGCPVLKCIYLENEIPYKNASWGSADYAFCDCKSLVAVSGVGLNQITTFSHAFHDADIPMLRTSAKATTLLYAFRYSRLVFFDANSVDTTGVTNMSYAFGNCGALKSVTGLNISALTNAGGIFFYCFGLARVVFAGETTPGGYTISLTDTVLDHDALVEMIASLPTATAAATIAITGLPGAAELTDDEIAVATAKNWTITR